jgi:uncharacterized SAM-binding protein YcdF (DUF218 family)
MRERERLPGWCAGLGLGAAAGFVASELDLPAAVSYWGDRAPIVIGAALAGAAVGRGRLADWLAGLTMTLLVAWTLVVSTPLVAVLAEGLIRRDALARGDAVFVLATRLQSDGELSTGAMSRLLRGLELLGGGWAETLVVSELPGHPSYAEAARGLAARLGLPGEVVAVGPVQNTRDEAVAVAQLFAARGWQRVVLVTSPTHSRRAAATFEAVGLEVISRPATETRFDLETLDRWDERSQAFGSVLHERLGIAVYRLRGWLR